MSRLIQYYAAIAGCIMEKKNRYYKAYCHFKNAFLTFFLVLPIREGVNKNNISSVYPLSWDDGGKEGELFVDTLLK